MPWFFVVVQHHDVAVVIYRLAGEVRLLITLKVRGIISLTSEGLEIVNYF